MAAQSRGAAWQVTCGQCIGSKMGSNAKGKGLWALYSSSGTTCSGPALDDIDGLEQNS